MDELRDEIIEDDKMSSDDHLILNSLLDAIVENNTDGWTEERKDGKVSELDD